MNEIQLWTLGLGPLIALLLLWLSLHQRGKQRLLLDLPSSKTKGVFIGLVEVKGTSECENPLRSYLSEEPVVHYDYEVSEHWSRTVQESYTDSKGKTQTRTRHESGWTTVASGSDSTPFYLRDDTGVLLIRPSGAKLDPLTLYSEECSRGDALYYGKGPHTSVPHSDHRRRFVESGIPLNTPLYIVGQARERADVVAAEIAADKHAPLFLISTKSEEKVRSGYALFSWFAWSLGFLISALAGWIFIAVSARPTPKAQYLLRPEETPFPLEPALMAAALGAGVYLLLWSFAWIWMAFNSLIGLRQRVNNAWSLIAIQLKRRHDLIPNLVQLLDTQAKHEKNLQTALASLRTQNLATAPGQSGPDFEGLSAQILAVVEDYPALGAQQGFNKLHTELVDTEQRIALARGYYNDITTHFATRLEQIPDRWVAALVNMKAPPLLLGDFKAAPVSTKIPA